MKDFLFPYLLRMLIWAADGKEKIPTILHQFASSYDIEGDELIKLAQEARLLRILDKREAMLQKLEALPQGTKVRYSPLGGDPMMVTFERRQDDDKKLARIEAPLHRRSRSPSKQPLIVDPLRLKILEEG